MKSFSCTTKAFFSSKIINFRLFLKTYLFIHVKKNLHNTAMSVNSYGGGGGQGVNAPEGPNHSSRCIFSVLLKWANAIKVWANASKMWGEVRGSVRYMTFQLAPFHRKLATALKIWICTLHSMKTYVWWKIDYK